VNGRYIVTAESVRKGHPDKFCDQVADRILDAHLRLDSMARIAVEVFATANRILVAGEITSGARVDCQQIVWETIRDIGYGKADLGTGHPGAPGVEVLVHRQSPDIAQAVGAEEHLGAGDQGIMVGYATDETPEFLPLSVVLTHRLCQEMDRLRPQVSWLGTDGKAQVSVNYENDRPRAVATVVVSTQHKENACPEWLRREIEEHVIRRAIPRYLLTEETSFLINPSGRFILGGPVADTGLTGRKLTVDLYGPIARIGGGALSGKDPTKVDRSGAYMARYIAKNIIAARLAHRCEVQIAYAIGREEPVGVLVDAFGTAIVPEDALAEAVRKAFDLRPAAIIRQLDLRKPIYGPLASYGHFGRPELDLPWERTDKTEELVHALLRLGFGV
jgi:S-adenosylmethionine synthetase